MANDTHTKEGKALADYMNGLLRKAVLPHVETIAKIWDSGRVAVVVFELDPEFHGAAKNCGWDGGSPVFELTARGARMLAEADHVTAAWLNRGGPDRLLLMMGPGSTLLLNNTDSGWSVEPGSKDSNVSKWGN